MWELLLVPLLGLGLLAVPLGNDDDAEVIEDMPTDDPAAEGPTMPDMEDPDADSLDDVVSRVTDGETLTGSDAGLSAPDEDGIVILSGTDNDDAIIVGDSETEFDVLPGDGADQITIGVNSSISMGEAVFGEAEEIELPEGEDIPEQLLVRTDTADTDTDDITLAVTQAGLTGLSGTLADGARVDLSDPEDALVIDIAEEIEGNLHLVQVEENSGSEALDQTIRYTLAIWTHPEVTALTDAQARAIGEGAETDVAFNQLARIDQGTLIVDNLGGANTVITRQDDLNENPLITSNREIASFSEVAL